MACDTTGGLPTLHRMTNWCSVDRALVRNPPEVRVEVDALYTSNKRAVGHRSQLVRGRVPIVAGLCPLPWNPRHRSSVSEGTDIGDPATFGRIQVVRRWSRDLLFDPRD